MSLAVEQRDAAGALYLYGIVDQRAVETLPEGVGGGSVETVEAGGLAALVTPLAEEGVRLRRRDLMSHLRVLEAAFAKTTVVPCPFGTVVDDENTLRVDVLEGRSAELRAALDRLRGRAQLNVKVVYDEDGILREVVREDPRVARLGEQTRELGDAGHFARIRLGELVSEALEGRRRQDGTRILARLEPLCEDLELEEVRDELTVVKGAFLVSDPDGFDAILEELARGDAGRLLYESIGPLPPTAFAAAAAGLGG